MKQSTLFVFLLITIKIIFSQTVITKDINFSIGDTYRFDGYEGVTNIEPGPAGSNQTWDFSQVSGTMYIEGDDNICVNPATTPFADSAAIANANICIRNIDEEVSPYQFFNCNNNYQDLVAIGFVGSENSSFSTYTNVLRVHEFPFSYGGNYNDSWELLTFHIDFGYYFMRDSAMVTVEAEATGSISTPAGQYQNTLRVKRTTTYYSWFKFTAGGEWIPSGPFTDITYEWYASNIKVPVMIIDELDGFTDYNVRYLVDHNFTTGITCANEALFQVFPNPARGKIQINSDKAINQVSIYSVNGQKLKVIPIHGGQLQYIDIKELDKGNYFLKAEFTDGTYLTRNILKQ